MQTTTTPTLRNYVEVCATDVLARHTLRRELDLQTNSVVRLSGPTIPVILGHYRRQQLLGTPVLFGENSDLFPMGLLTNNLPEYRWLRLHVDPSDLGFRLVSRKRSYFMGVHRQFARLLCEWDSVYRMICQTTSLVQTQPRDALLATDTQLIQEELEYCRVRSITPRLVLGPRSWSYMYTPHQQTYLNTYLSKMAQCGALLDWNTVFHLGDNPASHVVWSVSSGRIPTLRKRSNSLMFYPLAGRHLTSNELLACMGWPVFKCLLQPGHVLIHIDHSEGMSFIGNSMHLANVAVAVSSGLACVQLLAPT
jgi:hypothetical protein